MTNLKGYITNTDIDAERVIAEYHGLWVWNVFSEFQKGHWNAPASSSAKYTRNWRDLLALTRLR